MSRAIKAVAAAVTGPRGRWLAVAVWVLLAVAGLFAHAHGVLAALENTGGVVTGAGVILAGTFATLTLLPLEQLVQIGATVAIGVLLDTFVVRALLIPSIAYLLGERAWWPGRARELRAPFKMTPPAEAA